MSDADFSELEEEFGEVMAILAEGPLEAPTERPSEDVWAAIVGGVSGVAPGRGETPGRHSIPPRSDADPADLASDASLNGAGSHLDPASGHAPRPAGDHGAFGPDGPERSVSAGSNVVSLDSRRRWGRTAAILTGVAAAVVLIAVSLSLALTGGGPDSQADLIALDGFPGSGQAELDGTELAIDVEGLDEIGDGSFYELWLLDVDDSGEVADLRSLGRVTGDGTFSVPADIDIDAFSVVDVSVEPDDGDPTHSGASVLRGPLEATS